MSGTTRDRPEGEPVLAALRVKVEQFEGELMRYMRGEAEWCCDKCGQRLEPGEWVNPRTLREQVYRDAEYGDGSAISIALMNLVRRGELDQNMQWRVRLPRTEVP